MQPFKCGPDYIDTMFHEMATGRKSVNLDTFMSSPEHVKHLFEHYGKDSDMSIVEGVMGLFDGHDSWHGSSAEIAMILDLPIVLVVNAKSVAYSVAPLIHGFKSFVPPINGDAIIPERRENFPEKRDAIIPKRLNIAGVIFNQVASERHYQLLKSACADCEVTCLGYLPRNPKLSVPGRHLGLTISEKANMENFISTAAEEIEKHVQLELLI